MTPGRPAACLQLYLPASSWSEKALGRGLTYAFGVYIGHKICHCVLARSVTLLTQPDITMCVAKDLKIKKADVLPRSRSYLVQWPYNNKFMFFFCPNVNHMWNTGGNWISQFCKDNTCAQLGYGFTNVLSRPYGEFQPTQIYKFALFTWLFSVWKWLVVTLWLADFFARLTAFDLAAFWPGFFSSPANLAINSPSSCLRRSKKEEEEKVRPKEEMKPWEVKFRAWNIKSSIVWFQISFMSRTCGLQNSCGVNVATYFWDNLWRHIKKIRPQCDPCICFLSSIWVL